MKIEKLTQENIKPYGWIIDSKFMKDTGRGDKFGILLKEKSRGWRIGYLILRKKRFEKLERHPDSLETFEPISGRALMALAPDNKPSAVKVFYLDKSVVIKKGVWHDVAAVSGKCEMKIFENIEVRTSYYYLNRDHSSCQ